MCTYMPGEIQCTVVSLPYASWLKRVPALEMITTFFLLPSLAPRVFITPAMAQHVTYVPDIGVRFFLTFHQPYCTSVIQ